MTLEEATRYILERARAQGVAAEVLGTRDRELTLKAREGRLEEITQALQGGIGVRVVVKERVGYAFSEQLSSEALDWVLREAVENAGLQFEARGFLPDGQALGWHDLVKDAFAAPAEAKAQKALEFEAGLRKDPRVEHVLFGAYTEREREVSLGSTLRTDGGYRRGIVGLMGSMVMAEGASRKQAWDADWSTQFHALDPGRTALELTQKTGRLLGARPLVTGRYTGYFEPRALADLMAVFWYLWNGKAVMEGKSRLAGKLDQPVASRLVTLIDDPMLPGGRANRPFDVEGTLAHRTVLVENGILRNYLTNSETAQALGVQNTGHGWRRYGSALSVAPSNLYLQPGAGVQMSDGVIVAELMGVHAGANFISGDFSVQALGLLVKDGAVVHPVENLAVSGNFLTLLQNITALDTVLAWKAMMGPVFGAPLVEVHDLSFAGT